ncbi:MAG TPA: hypothetical protein VF791_01615 [Pyrinomonadaceae bacterium]
MMTTRTKRHDLPEGTSAATMMWQPCAGLSVRLLDCLNSLSPYGFTGGNPGQQTGMIGQAAIKDRHLRI